MPSCTIVAISWLVIWKPPSPTIAQTVSSGCASATPIAAGTREAHRARAAAGDMRARPVPVDQLRRPHLVLADVGDDAVVAALLEDAVSAA